MFRNIFDVRVKVFQQDCQNQILHFQWDILGKNFSMKKFVNSQSFFERRVKNLRQGCKKWIFIIRGTFLKKSFFETHYGSIDFVRASGANFSAGLSNLPFTFLRATLWEKGRKFLFEKNTFNNKFLRISGEKFSGRAVKFHSNFQEEQFARKRFVRKKFNNSEIFSGFGWKILGKFVKTAFYNFRGTFMENTFLWKTLNVQIFCAFVRASSEKFSAGLSKLHSVYPREHFVRKFLLENVYKFINVFWASVENFREGLWKLLSKYSEALFQGKLFHEKFIGSKFLFGLRLKNFRTYCQNCFLIFQRKILGEAFYLKELTKPYLFSVFGWNFFGRIVKTAFYIFKGTFMENTIVWEKL